MTEPTTPRASRRALLAASIASAAPISAAASRADATPPSDNAWRVPSPAWVFELLQAQDPYEGTMQVPAEVPAGSRVIAIEIEIGNDSDQALSFTPLDVRLRDATGIEYRGGAAIGTEPTINPRILNPGERSRGFVWYIVPEASETVEVVYVGPPPQFRVSLAGYSNSRHD